MKKLKLLKPDLIRDSIIEVRYQSHLPYELIVGEIFNDLESKGFNYNTPSKTPPNTFNVQIEHSFSNLRTRVVFQPARIVFNKTGSYPLWANYFSDVKDVIALINSSKINGFSRIGLRYINQLDVQNIFDCLNGPQNINFTGIFNTHATNLKTEIADDTFRVVLNVGNGYSTNPVDNSILYSLLDIDIIFESNTLMNKDQLIKTIDNCHTKEKEVFQKLLKNEYLETLKPEYE